MSYVYKQSEPGLWTVGYHQPDGGWNAESDHDTEEAAGHRTAYLNGAQSTGLLGACAPFDDFPDFEHLSDDVVVMTGNGNDGVYLKAGQVRAIKAAMSKVQGAGE